MGQDKILVVDDTLANLQLLMDLLGRHGYAVFPASTGELALEFVGSTLPDLVLLDIRMPDMNGYEICRRLKSENRTRGIPVIFLSVLEDESDKVRGFQEGAVDFISKPFQPEEVLARIGTHLRLRELTERLEVTVAERTAELETANARLQVELAGKELLLREVHHRVKNNLQVVSSLLSLEMHKNGQGSAQNGALLEMATRIEAMALVHEILYETDDPASVPIAPYIDQFCYRLLETYSVDTASVDIEVSVDSISLPIDRAIACGLLINEAVTDSLKSSFPAGRKGRIRVDMRRAPPASICLAIRAEAENAPGDRPSGPASDMRGDLMDSLARQLGGVCRVGRGLVEATFPLELPAEQRRQEGTASPRLPGRRE